MRGGDAAPDLARPRISRWSRSASRTACRALVRYLLDGLGTPDAQSADLMSYLLFDAAYTRTLVDIGYRDAGERIGEIEAFLRTAPARGRPGRGVRPSAGGAPAQTDARPLGAGPALGPDGSPLALTEPRSPCSWLAVSGAGCRLPHRPCPSPPVSGKLK